VAQRVIVLTGDEELRKNLALLAGAGGSRALAKAVNRVAFDVRLAEAQEIRSSFHFAGPPTEAFLTSARGIRFDAATHADLTAIVRPTPASEPILFDQATGAVISAADTINKRLGLSDVLAVPVGIERGPRGRVKRSETPGALLAKFGKRTTRKRSTRGVFASTAAGQRRARSTPYVFVNRARTAVLEAVDGSIRVLYALYTRARLTVRFQFLEVAEREARTQFPVKVEDELRKILAFIHTSSGPTNR
jgi:hypothetical protein